MQISRLICFYTRFRHKIQETRFSCYGDQSRWFTLVSKTNPMFSVCTGWNFLGAEQSKEWPAVYPVRYSRRRHSEISSSQTKGRWKIRSRNTKASRNRTHNTIQDNTIQSKQYNAKLCN